MAGPPRGGHPRGHRLVAPAFPRRAGRGSAGVIGHGDLDSLRLAAGDALLLDFDGTLTEIGPDPDAIRLEAGVGEALRRLMARLSGAVGILSGRDVRDLAARTPAEVWRIGTHGLEILAPGEAAGLAPAKPPEAVLAALRAVAGDHPGVRLEIKGPVAALHFRASPDAAEACLRAARQAAGAAAGHVSQAGKMVVEVKPAGAHKGAALRRLAERPPFAGRRPVVLGDDATDEDAIEAAQAMGGIGVKVGEGDSAARLRAPDPAAVRAWLVREAGT
ncbi:MAG: trehalose-phosphatase [Alphaproteobacteria bacterium]|nr:trehalose-phosphatase [Alphaproteobacteria bacterium]